LTEGEWPSWYENGKPSSLGTFKNGDKTGLWKYWDEAGWLKTEVTYTETGNLRTDYYPTGKSKATGMFVQSGKIGTWTYWDINGKEKAKLSKDN
jgi:antitoxin component YwqK of YwqJK toxin-antitoxin module